jgi:subtilase family protein/peptidase inhibitor I9
MHWEDGNLRSLSRRPSLLCATALVAFALVGLGVAVANSRHRAGPFAHGTHRGMSVRKAESLSRGTSSRVIVILRNQYNAIPATKRRIGTRIRAERVGNARILTQVRHAGGHVYRTYHALNAFAATVSKNERSALQKDAAVKQVVPDTIVQLPAPISARSIASTKSPRATAGNTTPQSQVCPSDPAKPLLEPEALQTTHTAFNDPNTPQAAHLASGDGVKVATFADGLDPNNPDLIRPNGQHVIADYQDFSGEGPNAPTGAAEAFGDVSSVAAQGNATYDISNFVNPAHPLPPGCTIKVRGIAPGATLDVMKVFGNSNNAFSSTILEGLDYALTHDHPDVFSESFGANPIPDSTQDLTRQFNEQAVAAGATVVESSGDSGVEASPSSAASDPSVIDAGASTTFRNYAQGTQYGFQFSNGTYLSDNISSIESAGFTQGGRLVDLVAPGEANWALCSANTAIFEECVDYKGAPTPLQSFGGTSESAPLIAGGAALVIQAYRQTHGGATPSPALVRQLLTSTSTDLGEPSVEQGAGEMNTLAAVEAARAVGNGPSSGNGDHLLVGPTQLNVSDQAGTTVTKSVRVSNLGSTTQIVHAGTRAATKQLSNQTGSVSLSSASPTFVDQFGAARPYQMVHFTVPAGADRLLSFIGWNGTTSRVGLTLLDPSGAFAAYTRPQGDGNHGEVDVAHPAAGHWTALIFRRDGNFTGTVNWQFIAQDFGTADSVSPSAQQIAPGQTKTFKLNVALPGSAGDSNEDLQFAGNSGTTTVPVAVRSLVDLGRNGGGFSGNLIGGNGRGGHFQPGQIDTYEMQVPAGKPEISVSLSFANNPGTEIFASLIGPDQQTVTAADNVHSDLATGNRTFTNALQLYAPSPRPGLWRFVVDVINPVGGQVLSSQYTGHVAFAPPPITVSGLPNSASTRLPAGQPRTATVSVTNDGVGIQDFFLDPRLPTRQAFSLLSITQATNLPFPEPAGTLPPIFLMPTQTKRVAAVAQATEPVTFDFGYAQGDPDLPAVSQGNTASASFSTPEATPGLWSIGPTPAGGPFSGPVPKGTVSTAMLVLTRGFDTNTSSSTGDIWQQTVDPNAPGFSPLTLRPGGHGTMTLTITPSGKRGKLVRGTVFVDVLNANTGNFAMTLGGEVVAIPYEYKVG